MLTLSLLYGKRIKKMSILAGLQTLLKPISLKAFLKGFTNHPLLGIDLGQHTIKLLQLKLKNLQISTFGSYTLPPEAITAEGDKRDEYILTALDALLRQLKINQKEVALCLPSKSVIIKKIELPRMEKKEEITSAVFREAEQYIPYELEDVNINYQVVSEEAEKSDRMEVLLVSAKKEVINHQVALVNEVGLIPYIIDVENFALVNAYEACYGKTPGPLAIIDVGASKINVVVVENNIPIFNREVPIGGIYLTKKIQANLNIDYEQAEKIKIEGTSDEKLLSAVKEVFVTVAQEWLQEITAALNFFESSAKTKINEIFLCGGSSRIEGFSECLERSLKKKVHNFNPFNTLRYDSSHFDPAYLEYYNSQIPIAFGLALRTMVER